MSEEERSLAAADESPEELAPLIGDSEERVHAVEQYDVPPSRKIGIPGAVSLILNKMIGTGSQSCPFRAYPKYI